MIQIIQLLTIIFINQVKFPEGNPAVGLTLSYKVQFHPTMSWLLGHPLDTFISGQHLLQCKCRLSQTLVAEEGNIHTLSWDLGMSGHSLKIQVFKDVLRECSGSPVLGLRAFTAMVQSLVGEQRFCKLHSVAKKKKKKCYKFCMPFLISGGCSNRK